MFFVGRYGLLQASSQNIDGGAPYTISGSGTDLIATMADGSVASYDAGDMCVFPSTLLHVLVILC